MSSKITSLLFISAYLMITGFGLLFPLGSTGRSVTLSLTVFVLTCQVYRFCYQK